jgi:hypothetical protein
MNKNINKEIIDKINKENDFVHYFRNKFHGFLTIVYFAILISLITVKPLKEYTFEFLFRIGRIFFKKITAENIENFVIFISCIFMILLVILLEIIFSIIAILIKKIGRKNGIYKI